MPTARYKEAVKEATSILEAQPGSAAALKTRAKAYEQLGLFKQALSDAQAVNKTVAASNESRDLEKRLREAMSTTNRARPASAAQRGAKAQTNPNTYQLTIKATCGSESKLLYTSFTVGYYDLYEAIKSKFPTSGGNVHAWPTHSEHSQGGAPLDDHACRHVCWLACRVWLAGMKHVMQLMKEMQASCAVHLPSGSSGCMTIHNQRLYAAQRIGQACRLC